MNISRRNILTGLTLTLVAGCGTDNTLTFQPASAQVATPPPPPVEPSFLYVQRALSGSLVPRGGDEFLLRLRGAETTTYFADRPSREFGSKPTAEFVARDFPAFGSDLPNAVLELGSPRQGTVLELLAASLEGQELEYRCRALPSGHARYSGGHQLVPPQGLPNSFGAADLFIDDGPPIPADNSLILNPVTGATADSGTWIVALTANPQPSVTVSNNTGETLTLETPQDEQRIYVILGPCPPGISKPGGFFNIFNNPQPGDTEQIVLHISGGQGLLGTGTVQLKFVAPP